MGRNLEVEWQEKTEELKQKYRAEKHPQRRERLFTLWHLRLGKQIREMSEITGTDERLIQRWVAWYREGGLEEVLRRVTGHGTVGTPAYLSLLQQKALVARVKLGDFRTVWDVIAWVKARWGIGYSYEGMRSVLKRNQCTLKVPRPQSEKADPKQQEDWQKKGFKTH
jgi:transposase